MKPFLKYFLIFITAFASTAIGTYIAVILVTSDTEEVVLPDLKNKNIIFVLETLTALDLNPKLYGTEYSKTCLRYHVISQDPEPGAVIKKGRDVVIYISKGEKLIKVPDLRYMLLADAKILIEKDELKIGTISKTCSDSVSKNNIISQYPNPNSQQKRNSPINLLISSGRKLQKYIMPDLYSCSLQDVKDIINHQNLAISSICSGKLFTMPQNVIISQTPKAGDIITKETKISLIVNRKNKKEFLNPDTIDSVVLISYPIGPGFLKKHVRISANLFGFELNLVDKYISGSKNVHALVPGGIKTKIKIYIDNKLVKTQTINPWKTGKTHGEKK